MPNALVLRGVNGNTITFSPLPDNRMEMKIDSFEENKALFTSIHNLDRGTTKNIRDYLSQWLGE